VRVGVGVMVGVGLTLGVGVRLGLAVGLVAVGVGLDSEVAVSPDAASSGKGVAVSSSDTGVMDGGARVGVAVSRPAEVEVSGRVGVREGEAGSVSTGVGVGGAWWPLPEYLESEEFEPTPAQSRYWLRTTRSGYPKPTARGQDPAPELPAGRPHYSGKFPR
jgi:hypothetical protein